MSPNTKFIYEEFNNSKGSNVLQGFTSMLLGNTDKNQSFYLPSDITGIS